ncbi:MAG: mechanosensitive ion channel family protein [Oscillospiraceae bacterium]|nr:mechanosensitive ion channel family protein [Oscillospiraceae bacterium]
MKTLEITTQSAEQFAEEAFEEVSAVAQWFEALPTKILDSLPKIVGAVVVIVIGYFISKFAGKLVLKIMKKNNVDESVHHFLEKMLVVSMRIVFVVFALSVLGVDVNSFVAALGAAGITAGLGLQSLISQFASGIEIMFNKPFKSGDFIELESISGTVEQIHFMNTTLLTPDNRRVIVPNSHITTNNLINYTAQNKRRLDLKFSISYGDDMALAKQIITKANEDCPYTIKDDNTRIAVGGHGESSITVDALLWCESPNYWNAYYDIHERVKLEFDKAGIHIPYNQLDVHVINN